MFTQKWRGKFGLLEDPFSSEDADKDFILESLDASINHWAFDRIFGTPKSPAPAIIFGEKGSGKSALRVMTKKRVTDHNEKNPTEKIFFVEYSDFNSFIENYRRKIGSRANDQSAAKEVFKRWKVADHLDSILTLGVTKMVDEILSSTQADKKFSRKQKINILIFTALYYSSETRTAAEAANLLNKKFKIKSCRPIMKWVWTLLASLIGVAVILLPHYMDNMDIPGENKHWFIAGLIIIAISWLCFCFKNYLMNRTTKKATRAIKVRDANQNTLKSILKTLSGKERKEYILPIGSDEDTRYQLLHRFIGLLDTLNYKGMYVLFDRIDEPSLLSPSSELMRKFVESMLDIKLLQYPQLGIKMFLPIELDIIHRNASSEDLKKMRLDKSNLISELKWSGQELYEIANQRLRACREDGSPIENLSDIFEDGFDMENLKLTLNQLGTPRYAFGFLSSLETDHVKNLPNDLPEDDPRWKISHSTFEIVKAAWVDRSGLLRRTLN